MKKILLSFALIASFPLVCPAKEDAISSQEASYDGATLTLKGSVILDHEFGLMQAEEAMLDKEDEKREFPFSRIHLKKEVVVKPLSSGMLHCEEALFNFGTLIATFSGGEKGNILFEEETASKNKIAFETSRAQMKMGINSSLKDLSAYFVESIEAMEKSRFTYNEAFVITAPKTIFKKGNQKNKAFAGEVVAFAKDEDLCVLTHGQDEIKASHMQLDIAHAQIALAHAKGILQSVSKHAKLELASEKLVWDEKNHKLILQGKSECIDETMGSYQTEKELILTFKEKEIASMHSVGPARLRLRDLHQVTHELFCPGSLEVDREHLQAKLTGSQTQQIRYVHPFGTLYASVAEITYREQDKEVKPQLATLSQNVKMLSSDEEKIKVCIADKMEFLFQEQKLILQAASGKRVLYWEPSQGIAISATEVHITKDPKTHKEEVKGVGSIRFSFNDAEKEIIKKHYPQLSK